MFEDEEEIGEVGKHSYKNRKEGDRISLTSGREMTIQQRHKNMGKLVRTLRENAGMTIDELLSKTDVPKTAFQKIEAGVMDVKYVYVERVLGYFGYSLMPFFDINDPNMGVNLSNSLKKTDFLVAAQMARMAEKMPVFKKFDKQGRDLEKFFQRAKRYQEMRTTKSNERKKEIRKKYEKIMRRIDSKQYNILEYKPNCETQREANAIIKKYNKKRLERLKAVRRQKMMGKKFFQQLYNNKQSDGQS